MICGNWITQCHAQLESGSGRPLQPDHYPTSFNPWHRIVISVGTLTVRRHQREDDAVLARLFSETVRAINSSDYTPQQVEAWASAILNLQGWLAELGGRTVFVAEHDSTVVGFATFEPNGHLDHLYVHHRFQRRGAGSLLLRQIENEAASRAMGHIFAEVSVTARAFFERHGFRVTSPQIVQVKGIPFLNYRMEKCLAANDTI
jgi:putative acetyltransferase